LLAEGANCFLSRPAASAPGTNSLGAHISAWRDMIFEEAPQNLIADSDGEPVREICVFPFPPTDVLVQGETKELCLYEQRFHNLFEKATKDHAGIVAMGFIAPPNGMLQCMPLCEVENFQTLEGDTGFGNTSILATIRVVGRAMLLDVQDPEDGVGVLEGYMKGWCTELTDDKTNFSSDGDLMAKYNELADKCEDLFESIVSLREKIASLEEKQQKEALKKSGGSGGSEVLSEATLKRMKLEAELGLDGDDDDEEEDDEEEDDYLDDLDEDSGPKSTFRKAFQTAKASDTQGYTISLFDDSESTISTTTQKQRSIQDLTALSWAYFSKDLWGEAGDDDVAIDGMLLKYRLSALNTVDLSERLILVSKMLLEQQIKLKKKREKLQ